MSGVLVLSESATATLRAAAAGRSGNQPLTNGARLRVAGVGGLLRPLAPALAVRGRS